MKSFSRILIIYIVVSNTICVGRSYQWTKQAKCDLGIVHDAITKYYAQSNAKENNSIKLWTNAGYSESIKRAQHARSVADYKAVLNYYIAGFKDSHLQLKFNCEGKNYWWPCFIVNYVDGKYKVAYTKKCLSELIPVGTEIVAIDGLSVKEFTDLYSTPYINFSLNTEREKTDYAFKLFIHDGNQWQKRPSICTLATKGQQKDFPLVYKRIHVKTFNNYNPQTTSYKAHEIIENSEIKKANILICNSQFSLMIT